MREPLWHMYRHIIIALVELKRYFNCTWIIPQKKKNEQNKTNETESNSRQIDWNWIVSRVCRFVQLKIRKLTLTQCFWMPFYPPFFLLLHTNMNLYVHILHTQEMYFPVYVPSSLEYLCIVVERTCVIWMVIWTNRLNIFFLFCIASPLLIRPKLQPIVFVKYWRWTKRMSVSWKNMNVWPVM